MYTKPAIETELALEGELGDLIVRPRPRGSRRGGHQGPIYTS
jgi:hypothetical protein